MQKFRWLAILMGLTILGITGFQAYWLKNNYEREEESLELQTNTSFRQIILRLHAAKLKFETLHFDQEEMMPAIPPPPGIRLREAKKNRQLLVKTPNKKEPPITIMSLLQEKMQEMAKDSTKNRLTISTHISSDSISGIRAKQRNTSISTITISASSDSLVRIDPKVIQEMGIGDGGNEGKPGRMIIVRPGAHDSSDIVKKDTTAAMAMTWRRPPDQMFERELPKEVAEDVVFQRGRIAIPGKEAVVRFLYNIDSIATKDSVTIKEVTDAYAAKLKEDKMNLAFAVSRIDSSQADSTALNEVTVGLSSPVTYKLGIPNKTSYILKELTLPILFSLLLVSITVASFVLLYRNLLKQRRLAELKNQFISNITHELKTPIATVGVAIEALQNFNAIHDPQRTQEYLNISQNELQRLSLLVDKVLKLSMFEKKEIELKKEQFDCRQLVEEVMNSMKLQFDKYRAKVKLHTEGNNFVIDADKLHITSVIYNLLDNALKYSKEDPSIDVKLASYTDYVEFSVKDNGIGIEPAYRQKIFEKFFRVPTGDNHTIKGYGLGLSYVAEVIKRHHGYVYAESELGKGSTFVAKMPYKEAKVIKFDDKKSFRKEV